MPPAHPPDPGRPDASIAEAMVIEELAEGRLGRSAHAAVRAVRCEYRDGSLTLRGRLPSDHLKQVAQECVSEVVGVREVVNRIEVIEPSDRQAP